MAQGLQLPLLSSPRNIVRNCIAREGFMVDTTISHYKVLEKIGKGGMGEVYRATDTKLNRGVGPKITF